MENNNKQKKATKNNILELDAISKPPNNDVSVIDFKESKLYNKNYWLHRIKESLAAAQLAIHQAE